MGCGGDTDPFDPGDFESIPGVLDEVVTSAGPPGPPGFGLRLTYKGQLSPSGLGRAHLLSEAGNMNLRPLIRCYVQETVDSPFIEIQPVEDSSLPCGLAAHAEHVDVHVRSESDRIAWVMVLAR